jgi:ubiquinone/menaquinone biosynthesis C-methylase UbiE
VSAAETTSLDTSEMDIKQKQAAYHDWEAQTYEEKFSISYDQRCIDYALARLRKVVDEPVVSGTVLEVGAGTGFFLINLALAGAVSGELHATDISPGMLEVCARNGREHGFDIVTEVGDAEALPYADDTFDLVIGHAFIHHLPVPGKAIQEMHRVLKPGGRLVIAGEPTELGDAISKRVKHTTWRAFMALTALPGMQRYRKPELQDGTTHVRDAVAALEDQVDLHVFRPRDVAHMADIAGFTNVRVETEELTANWVGWAVRTVEGSIAPGTLGMRWAMAAFRTYLGLTWFDEHVMDRFVPDALFYNLILYGEKPS